MDSIALQFLKYRHKLRILYLRLRYGNNYGSRLKNTEVSMAKSLPEKIYQMHGFKAVIRSNTDDYYLLYLDRERIYNYLALLEGETFLDIGANVGYYTLRAASDYNARNIKIISVEAHPFTFKALVTNIKINGFTNIETINKAIGNTKGLVTIYDERDENDNVMYGHSSTFETAGRVGTYKVESTTIDELLASRKVDVIKIDVEGAELDVLKGGSESFKSTRRIVVEIHENNLKPVEKLLGDWGFSSSVVGTHGMQHIIGTKRESKA